MSVRDFEAVNDMEHSWSHRCCKEVLLAKRGNRYQLDHAMFRSRIEKR